MPVSASFSTAIGRSHGSNMKFVTHDQIGLSVIKLTNRVSYADSFILALGNEMFCCTFADLNMGSPSITFETTFIDHQP